MWKRGFGIEELKELSKECTHDILTRVPFKKLIWECSRCHWHLSISAAVRQSPFAMMDIEEHISCGCCDGLEFLECDCKKDGHSSWEE